MSTDDSVRSCRHNVPLGVTETKCLTMHFLSSISDSEPSKGPLPKSFSKYWVTCNSQTLTWIKITWTAHIFAGS